MPEAKQHDDSERSQLKNLRDENTFLKTKVLYLEKLMEIVGIDPEMISAHDPAMIKKEEP